MTMQRFSDEDLTAYLDKQMSSAEAAAVSSALESSPDLRQRLQGLMLDRQLLEEAFDAVLAKAPEPPAALQSPRGAKAEADVGGGGFDRRALAAAAVAGLLVGASGLFLLPGDEPRGWHEAAAVYHKLYITETLGPETPTAEQLSAELARVSARLQRDIRLEDLAGLAALTPRRAQILAFETQPLVQIAFLSRDGTPVALCILRSGQTGEVPVKMASLEGMSAAVWARDGYEFMLIGGIDDARISTAATALSESL